MMKAVQITGVKAAYKIVLTNALPKPVPKGSDILIKVHAAGITADEVTWSELYDSSTRVPGHDISGVVEALGPEYNGPIVAGNSVYAMLDAATGQGGQAEYVTAKADEIALKPTSISHAEAAALPIPVLTAWEAIFEKAKLERGSKILVTGASGAVGIMLVQLAHHILGAEVIGLASAKNYARLLELGASRVIDYNSNNWEETIKGVDAVFDTVGNSTLAKAWHTVKSDGIIVTVADPPPPWAFGMGKPEELLTHPKVRWDYFVVKARGDTLSKAATLLETGPVKPLPIKAFGVADALEAWKFAAQRGRDGKVVIKFVAGE
ncbi:putative zinc-binding oxidoreductase-like protein [Cladobotryum mycophilum]|uniref:Zinc-binding oxidoreductase-like protein n=1 Tax=Cladobotryum mycophilum TaxID=491253 RepID=A0ABR0SPC8_9HYPO